ncbi:MAG: hypothetical protein EHM33_06760 [Chloroflexi bacterium]|nr:MAG: hypothetical protein EHM33_06760 [Chloroflexota bacterium]
MLDVSSENLLRSVFHTLAYSDVFDYPLTAGEVYYYLTSMRASLEEVTQNLADQTLFARVEPYFTLRGREGIVETRKRRSETAKRLWSKAARYGRILARLPFVRMVAVTGSLAMNNTDEGKDIDFMIVTMPGRLWICRGLSLLVGRFAKLEGVNLCPNYLVTTNALELQEQSLYVAHELVQMIPLSGMEMYYEIHRLNDWTANYLPNANALPEMPPGVQPLQKRAMVQRILEIFLSLPFGDWLEKWEMDRKISRLTREQSASFESYFSADVCKGHIDRHGENIVTALAVRLASVRASYPTDEGISLKETIARLDQVR